MIAIPYRHQTGIELKFCLRSIEKYSDEEVTIIGDLPDWCQKVKHIPYSNSSDSKFKERNILEKLLLMSEDFYYFNDDFFLLKELSKEVHYSGLLTDRMDGINVGNPFRQVVINTIIGGAIYNHYRHGPMFISRNKLEVLTKLNWNNEWGYCIKSMYAFLNNIEGVNYPDLKIRESLSKKVIFELIKDRPYFSNNENSMNGQMVEVLRELFPLKSRFEK